MSDMFIRSFKTNAKNQTVKQKQSIDLNLKTKPEGTRFG